MFFSRIPDGPLFSEAQKWVREKAGDLWDLCRLGWLVRVKVKAILCALLSSDDCFSLPPLPSLTGWPRGTRGAGLSLTGQRGGQLRQPGTLNLDLVCSSPTPSFLYPHLTPFFYVAQSPAHISIGGAGRLPDPPLSTSSAPHIQAWPQWPVVTLRSPLDCAPGTVRGDTSPIAHSHCEHLGQHQAPKRASYARKAQR